MTGPRFSTHASCGVTRSSSPDFLLRSTASQSIVQSALSSFRESVKKHHVRFQHSSCPTCRQQCGRFVCRERIVNVQGVTLHPFPRKPARLAPLDPSSPAPITTCRRVRVCHMSANWQRRGAGLDVVCTVTSHKRLLEIWRIVCLAQLRQVLCGSLVYPPRTHSLPSTFSSVKSARYWPAPDDLRRSKDRDERGSPHFGQGR